MTAEFVQWKRPEFGYDKIYKKKILSDYQGNTPDIYPTSIFVPLKDDNI